MKFLVITFACLLAAEALPLNSIVGGAGMPLGPLVGGAVGGLGQIAGPMGPVGSLGSVGPIGSILPIESSSGFGSGNTLGQSGYASGQSGFGSRGYGQSGINQAHNIGHQEDDYKQVVSSHHSSGHNVGNTNAYENGGSNLGGYNAYGTGSNLYQNGYNQGGHRQLGLG